MPLKGQRLHIRCFIEGIEIPIIAANVEMSINAPAACSIEVIYTDELNDLKARSMVHIFFYDFHEDEVVDLGDINRYQLLFAGETVGYSYVKTGSSRQAVLQCTDFTTNWDLCYQYMVTFGKQGNFLHDQSAVWAGANSLFNNIIDSHGSVLEQYLTRQPKTEGLQDLKGLLGGIVALIEVLGGSYNHSHGVNDYFTISELKNRTMQQVTAEQNDDTTIKIFKGKEFMNWLNSHTTSLGELCTIRDMLKLLMSFVYYEIVPNTCAYYIPGSKPPPMAKSLSTPATQPSKASTRPANKDINDAIAAIADHAAELSKGLEELNKQTTNIKSSNIDQTISASTQAYTEEYKAMLKDLKGLAANTAVLSSKQVQGLKKSLIYADRLSKSVVNPKALKAITKDASTFVKSLRSTIKSSEQQKSNGSTKSTKREKPKLDRLVTTVIRPECFFVAPPRCNVIFPEIVTQFSFSRNYTKEYTRLRLQAGSWLTGNEKLLAEYTWAPTMEEIKRIAKQQGINSVRALLPWEIFTGILPKFEYVHDMNFYANKRQRELRKDVKGQASSYQQLAANFNYFKYRFGSRSASVSMKFNPYLVLGFPTLIIDKPYIIDPDAFNAIAAANNISLDAAATPQNVFDNIKSISALIRPPTQHLGMIMGLTHSINQDGGTTSIGVSFARTHRISDDDFLIKFLEQKTKESGVTTVNTILDADDLIKRGDQKNLRFLIDATSESSTQPTTQSSETKLANRPQLKISGFDLVAPSFKVPAGKGVPNTEAEKGSTNEIEVNGAQILVPAVYGKLQPGSIGPKGGTVVQVQILNDAIVPIPQSGVIKNKKGKVVTKLGGVKMAWKTIVIYEEIKSSKLLKQLPLEEALRPKWFSALFSNIYIGENIYQPYFGTGSLVDEIVFQSPNGLSIQGAGSDKNSILEKLGNSENLLGDVSQLHQDKLYNLPDVETATNVLAFQYGEIKRQGLDSHKFIHDYTSRPIATLPQILGSADLEYEKVGNKLQIKENEDGSHGTPGFHSTAVAPFGELLGLVDNPDIGLPRLNEKGKEKIDRSIDPRPPRRAAAQAYADSLEVGGGMVIGLLG